MSNAVFRIVHMNFDPLNHSTLNDLRRQKWHLPVSAEIREQTERTAELVYDYNHTRPSDSKRLKQLLMHILSPQSEDCTIKQPMTIEYGCNTTVGKDAFINYNVTILDTAEVTIGAHAMIGPNCQLVTVTHPVDDAEMRAGGWEIAHPIAIGDHAWLGAGVIVLPGVSIGQHAVIGAGSIVSKDIPDYAIAMGQPARVVRMPSEASYERSELAAGLPIQGLKSAVRTDDVTQ
ncbi:Maltose O-acetyltransferase [Corynebacterium ulcerans]|uniref:Maltose O-acetyltransferase n=2 Tax=Corynebacterium ulcerans TaxID=65058 RepID=A0ABM5TYC7_CORUL|nr:sugar O-acetyltransferase [Corynebacterium ulcerans]AIU29500.1 Maltose O-acetyltransferase [Corynebacterium ulcerans]AIU90734.1 Maltose O-acetyltransferase [Corynebacterium ulcerans]AKN75982.1 Maltose O-acetyltransferase [Corynebacterium ulcerans FRC58]NOL61945.1 sugar O-acetyltransferase [Corynebacterium ulcerans]NON16729.1 sugar O-acetyltransferase [Corynebacterium ulcerans]